MFSPVFPAYICDSNTLEKRNTELSIQCMYINIYILIFDAKDKNFPNSPACWEKVRFCECENGKMRRKEMIERWKYNGTFLSAPLQVAKSSKVDKAKGIWIQSRGEQKYYHLVHNYGGCPGLRCKYTINGWVVVLAPIPTEDHLNIKNTEL